MKELETCPFCGSESLKAVKKSALAGWTGMEDRVEWHTFYVRCNLCYARGGTAGGKVIVSGRGRYKDGLPEWATTDEELMKKAVELWNGRNYERR